MADYCNNDTDLALTRVARYIPQWSVSGLLFTFLPYLHGGVYADSAEYGGGYRRDDFKDDGDVLFVLVSHF